MSWGKAGMGCGRGKGEKKVKDSCGWQVGICVVWRKVFTHFVIW